MRSGCKGWLTKVARHIPREDATWRQDVRNGRLIRWDTEHCFDQLRCLWPNHQGRALDIACLFGARRQLLARWGGRVFQTQGVRSTGTE
jgi:hypothetical protein